MVLPPSQLSLGSYPSLQGGGLTSPTVLWAREMPAHLSHGQIRYRPFLSKPCRLQLLIIMTWDEYKIVFDYLLLFFYLSIALENLLMGIAKPM